MAGLVLAIPLVCGVALFLKARSHTAPDPKVLAL
jgi:hypothetical protein